MFLGRHTALSWLAAEKGLESVPLFRELGAAPPYLVVVGDRRRAARVLAHLEDSIDLADHCRREIGAGAEGRVAIGAGRTGAAAVLVAETQMGGPASEIILREVLDRSFHPGGAAAVPRVGTCGTITADRRTPPLVVAEFATGWSAAVEQAARGVCGAPAEFDPERPPAPPQLMCTPAVTEALMASSPGAMRGGVYSKDSLYAEQDHRFSALMRGLGCLATEMEIATIGPVADSLGVAWGGIMATAGALDRHEWYREDAIAAHETRAIQGALAAIRLLHEESSQ